MWFEMALRTVKRYTCLIPENLIQSGVSHPSPRGIFLVYITYLLVQYFITHLRFIAAVDEEHG